MMGDKHKILLVDNERGFLILLKEFFNEKNYEVISAKNGKEGVDLLNCEWPFSVIISDQRMPKMMGIEFLKIARIISPITPRILITAFQETRLIKDSINESEVFAFVTKPIDLDSLNIIVQSAIKEYETKLQTIKTHRILFAGGKIGLMVQTKEQLLKKGFNFEFVQNSDEFTELLKRNVPAAVVVVRDISQNIDGLEFLRQCKKNWPKSIRILLTNLSNLAGMKDAINEIGIDGILTSPFVVEELEELLKSSLQKYDQMLTRILHE